MGSVSKLSDKCKKCPHVSCCDKKRKMACAIAELPEPMVEANVSANTAPVMADVLVKHNYRDVHIGPETITVDLEDIKERLSRDFYKAAGLSIGL